MKKSQLQSKPAASAKSTQKKVVLSQQTTSQVNRIQKEENPNPNPKPQKEVASKPTGQQLTSKDIFRLRYFRFKAIDWDATIDFYQTLGMNLDFKSEQSIFVQQASQSKRNTTNQTQGKSIFQPKNPKDLNLRLPPKYVRKSILGFSFKSPGSSIVDPNDHMQLIFEKELKQEEETTETNVMETRTTHSSEYLVIYVHFIDRIVKRLSTKGFQIQMETKIFYEMKMAILKDPNGLQIRLMELSSDQLGESEQQKRSWFARLGYYTIPTHQCNDCIDFYEDILNVSKQRNATQNVLNDVIFNEQSLYSKARPTGLRPIEKQSRINHSFRLMDAEEFMTGLIQNTYYWMANDSRSTACSVCFTQKSDFDTTFDSKKNQKQNFLLLSIGFHVSQLEPSIQRIKLNQKHLIWEDSRQLMAKVGIIARCLDKLNNIWIEFFTSKIPDPPKTHESRIKAWQLNKPFDPKDDETLTHKINRKHLKGHCRHLSMDAIQRLKTHLEEDEELMPSRAGQFLIKKYPSLEW